MTATLCSFPVFRAFTVDGLPAVGYRLWSYAAGTSNLLPTYTNAGGGTANANPVVLDATGSANVWLGTAAYKLVLEDATGATHGTVQWTVDNVLSDAAVVALGLAASDLASTSNVALGDALVGVKQPYTGAVGRTQHAKNTDLITVRDFGATGDGATDDTAAFQAAINYCITLNVMLHVPAAAVYYKIAGNLSITHGLHIYGQSGGITNQYFGSQSGMARLVFTGTEIGINIPVSSTDGPYGVTLENITLVGNANMTYGVKVAGTSSFTAAYFNLIHCSVYGFIAGIGVSINYCTSNAIERCIIQTCGVALQLNNAMDTDVIRCNLEQSLVGLDVIICNSVVVIGGVIEGCNYGRTTTQSLAMPASFNIYAGWGAYRNSLALYAGTGIRAQAASMSIIGTYMEGNTWGILVENTSEITVTGGYVEIDNSASTTGDRGFIDIRDGAVTVSGTTAVLAGEGAGFVGLINQYGAFYAAPLKVAFAATCAFTTAQIFTGTGTANQVGTSDFFESAKYRILAAKAHIFQTGNNRQLANITETGAVDLSTAANANHLWVIITSTSTATFNWTDTTTAIEGTEITLTVISSGSNTIAFGTAFRTDAATYAMTNGTTMTWSFIYTNGAWRSRYIPVLTAQ